jgi:AcrR family transcriptional regulator
MREQVTAAILEATEDVIATRGLEGASIAAIAERAGVAVGTLYNYFPDRDELIASLFKQRRSDLAPRLAELAHVGARQPAERRLRDYLDGLLALFEEQRKYIRVVVAVDPGGTRGPVLLPLITTAIADILRPGYGKRSDEYAHMIVGCLKLLVRWRVEQGASLAGDAELIAHTFLHGMVKR